MITIKGKDIPVLLAAVRQADFDSDEYHHLLASGGCDEHLTDYADQAIASGDCLIGVIYRLLHNPDNWG